MAKAKLNIHQPASAGYFGSRSDSIDFIHSGCTLLDCVLGGGWALSRISNVIGDKAVGKTLLAIEACANFARQYPKGRIQYEEAESAFDLGYAQALGLPARNLELRQDVSTVEEVFKHMVEFVGSLRGQPGFLIVDSLDALSDEAELKRELTDATYGATKAKQLSQLFRRLVRDLDKARVHVMIISQVRDNIGATFGRKWTRSGGRALDFYSSQTLVLSHLKRLKRTVRGVERADGVRIRAHCEKNKCATPFREASFDIRFGYGIDDAGASLDWLEEVKRLDALGISKAEVPKLLKELEAQHGEEGREARSTIAKTVTEVWYEIEREFLPKRRKYE